MNAKAMATLAMLGMVSGCATADTGLCGPNDHAIRYTDQQIDQMTDEQVKGNLARNEELERRGCAVPN